MGSQPERPISEELQWPELPPIINKNTEPGLLLSSDFKNSKYAGTEEREKGRAYSFAPNNYLSCHSGSFLC